MSMNPQEWTPELAEAMREKFTVVKAEPINFEAAFEKHGGEFLKFERIPVERRFSNRPDLHAFILLDKLIPGTNDMVSYSAHDEFFLDIKLDDLEKVITEEQVIDLIRCGVRRSSEYDCLALFT